MPKMKLNPYLMLFTKISSKWVKNINIRPETIGLLEENIGKVLDIIPGNTFENDTKKNTRSKSKASGATGNKKLLKSKNFSKVKKQLVEWEKIFSKPISDKR